MRILRSVLAALAGLVLITAIVEPLEFALVALVNGGMTTDQNIYLSVRNQPGFLAAKLLYNTAAAFVGGFVAAWLARRAPAASGPDVVPISSSFRSGTSCCFAARGDVIPSRQSSLVNSCNLQSAIINRQ